jgi:hypothetical protein
MNANEVRSQRVRPSRYVVAAIGVVSMFALHGCVYVGGGWGGGGGWHGGGGGWHGGGGGWHGGRRCEVGPMPDAVGFVNRSTILNVPSRSESKA